MAPVLQAEGRIGDHPVVGQQPSLPARQQFAHGALHGPASSMRGATPAVRGEQQLRSACLLVPRAVPRASFARPRPQQRQQRRWSRAIPVSRRILVLVASIGVCASPLVLPAQFGVVYWFTGCG